MSMEGPATLNARDFKQQNGGKLQMTATLRHRLKPVATAHIPDACTEMIVFVHRKQPCNFVNINSFTSTRHAMHRIFARLTLKPMYGNVKYDSIFSKTRMTNGLNALNNVGTISLFY
jgi:hypothetical protein